MNAINYKDIIIRALKTFVQAFVSAISIDTLLAVSDKDALKKVLISMLIAGVASGVSAVWNLILCALEEKNDENCTKG